MLTSEEFSAWCQRNQMSPEAGVTIQQIRTSPPARRVRARASNMSGRYPSVKMGCSIQFESQVEFLAIYAMERDEDVLEYYDQPTRIQLHYRSKSGSEAGCVSAGRNRGLPMIGTESWNRKIVQKSHLPILLYKVVDGYTCTFASKNYQQTSLASGMAC